MVRPWVRVFPPEESSVGLQFDEEVGPKNIRANVTSPTDFFHLLFPVILIRELVRQTNKYAREFLKTHRPRPNSRSLGWRPTTMTEMRGFIAVILNMGLIRKPTIAEYWNCKHTSQATPWFRKMFSRNRFQQLLNFFHVADNSRIPQRNSPAYRPHLKFKPLLDFVNRMFQRYYTPTQDVCVDETLVATRGRTVLRQFMKNKAAKFGVKFWVLAESATGYVMNMICYLGKTFAPVQQGTLQGTTVLEDLFSRCDMLYKHYHVTVDSFFCSINLAETLLPTNTYVTGTLRVNRPMPQTIKNANPDPGTAIYMRRGEVLVCAAKNEGKTKTVRLLSTKIKVSHSRLPNIVAHYNKHMGGVDEADMLMSFYSAERKTVKVWKKMAFHILFRCCLNAYVLYDQHTQDQRPKSRMRFMQEIVEGLAADHLAERHPPAHQPQHRRQLKTLPGNR